MSVDIDPTGQGRLSCSQLSRDLEEPLFGSVSQTRVWFLLEYPYPIGAKAYADSNLPASFKTAFSSFVGSLPGSRILLIKRRTEQVDAGVTLFVCLSREKEPALYEFKAGSYEELLALSYPSILAEDPLYDEYRRAEPLFTVCTNGRRDPCCARWGLPLYEALTAAAPGLVWQSSHVGGHRFAPNLVCFPHAVYYGRVEQGRAPGILDEYRRGLLSLQNYRGRSVYPAAAQAAEFFLRRENGSLGLEDFLLHSVEQLDDQSWSVSFAASDGASLHHLRISARPSGALAPESCRAEELKPVMLFNLDQYVTARSEPSIK